MSKRIVKKLVPFLIVLVALVVVVVLGLTLRAKLLAGRGEFGPREVPAVNVQVVVVTPEAEMVDSIRLPAVVEPNRVVKIAAEVAGRVEEVAVEEGEVCEAGAPIVYLNSELLQADFDRAAAQAEFDRADYGRISYYHKEGGATDRELDQAAARMALSKAAMEAAGVRLDRAKIATSVRGVVNELMVEKGEYVQGGSVVAEIVDVDTVKVVVWVPERDVQFLEVGKEAEVLANTRGNEKKLTGTITYISELADEQTRSTRTEVTVDNRERSLRSGQIVRVRLVRRVLKDAIMIPLLAVIPMEEGKAVYVVEDGKAERREVELGLIKGREVQVVKGLESGDALIVAGHRYVAPGQRVEIVSGD